MKRHIGIAFLLFLLVFPLGATGKEQDLPETEKLAATAKIWGFLKYYHPGVANGSFNWDEQLLEKLEGIEKIENKKELSEFFLKWIEELGEVPELDFPSEESSENLFNKNFDLSWIESGMFSKKLEKKLRSIEKNRFRGNHFYVQPAEQVGNAIFTNEKEYKSFTWDQKNLRLLALFRYWNQVEYFFPYKYQMDENWDQVLKEMLPLFLNPASEMDYQLAMLATVAKLDDAHAYLITPGLNKRLGFYWAPVELHMLDKQPVVTDFMDKIYAEKDDWKLGDIVLAVNGLPVSEILEKEKRFLTGSNYRSKHRDIHIPLLNGNTDSVEVLILRNGEELEKKVTRYYRREFRPDNSNQPWKFLDNNIGYVDLGLLEREDVPTMYEEFKDASGIIIDARAYPRGTWYALANHLQKENYGIAKSLVPVLDYPGKFRFTETLVIPHDNPDVYEGKVVLLMDEYTQSQGEYTIMALQNAPNVTTIGRPTAGANGNFSDISFVGGYTTGMSGIGVFHPDGRETQRVGISPDIKVERTIPGIKKGEDEILNKALDFLKQD